MVPMAATVEWVAEDPPRMQRIGEATPALPPLPTCGPGWGGSRSPTSKNTSEAQLKKQPSWWKLCSKLVPCPWVSARGQAG